VLADAVPKAEMRGAVMSRKMVDCRKVPSDINCTLAIAGTEDEVLDAAVAHAVSKHGHEDTPVLRQLSASGLEDVERALA
jgi:predicted small metal-binding protein